MARITAIESQKRDPDRMNIRLDGEHAFSLASLLSARLKLGQDLAPQDIASLIAEDARERAYQQALQFLSYRPRSEAEIRRHLRKHKVAEELLEQTLLRLRNNRLADDKQFAGAWVENRNAFRPRGRRALAWELHQKGVSSEAVQTALTELDEPALAYQAGLKKARQLSLSPWADFRTRLYSFLARRGFPSSIIAPVVSRLWNETHAGQPISDNEDIP